MVGYSAISFWINKAAGRIGARRFLYSLLTVAVLALLFLPAATNMALAQTVTPEPEGVPGRFGVIESYEDPAAAARLGAAWTRLRFQWAEVQADGRNSWEPPLDDEVLAAELEAGRMVVGLLIGIPGWARDRDGLPRGLYRPLDDPNNTWAAFVRNIVDRYAGRIDHWIIWNEPDIADPEALGHTWDGTIEDFLQLQRTAYLVAKETNPDVVIHLGAFTYYWDPEYFGNFLDVVMADPEAADNNHYFDIATAHLYFQPNSVYEVIDFFKQEMAARELDKPVWLVETNAPPMDDPYWEVPNWTLAVTLNEQAAFIPQALAAALAAGVERIAVYKLRDIDTDRLANPEPFGLIRWDSSRRPAFDTYRVAIRQMVDVIAAERERWDAVAQIRLDQPEQTTTVLFARLPQPQTATVLASSATAELIDMWGKRQTVDAEDGFFTIELPGALCLQTIGDYCMIGSTTYYLVQDAPPWADRLTPTPEPTTTPRPTATPTASATPQPPATPTASATPRPTATATAELTPTEPAATSPAEPQENPVAEETNRTGLLFIVAAAAIGAILVVWQVMTSRRT